MSFPSANTTFSWGSSGSTGTSNYLVDPDVQRMLRVREGDELAFGELVALHQNRLVGLLGHLTGDRELAEDLAQDVFLRLYRARGRYEPTAKFTTYLFRIAHNVALNSRRSKSRRKESVIPDHSNSRMGASPIRAAAEKSSVMPTRRAASGEVQSVVQEAVERLPERQRMALLLHKFEDMSYADIGAAMDLSVSAVKSLLSRARESLRVELEGYMSDAPAPLPPA